MMKKGFLFLLLAAPMLVRAEGAAIVYDPTNHNEGVLLRNQTICNTTNLLNSLELQRKWLEAIQKQDMELTAQATEIKNKAETIKTETATVRKNIVETVRVLGDPAKIDVDVTDIQQVTPAKNQTLAELKSAAIAKANTAKELDAELFGNDADPAVKYAMAEAAFQNYNSVMTSCSSLKEKLIVRREALKSAINKTNTIAGQQKIQTALLAINGQLEDIDREERSAYNKLEAIQARNEIVEKQMQVKRQNELISQWDAFTTTLFDKDAKTNAEKTAAASDAITASDIEKLGTKQSISSGSGGLSPVIGFNGGTGVSGNGTSGSSAVAGSKDETGATGNSSSGSSSSGSSGSGSSSVEDIPIHLPANQLRPSEEETILPTDELIKREEPQND